MSLRGYKFTWSQPLVISTTWNRKLMIFIRNRSHEKRQLISIVSIVKTSDDNNEPSFVIKKMDADIHWWSYGCLHSCVLRSWISETMRFCYLDSTGCMRMSESVFYTNYKKMNYFLLFWRILYIHSWTSEFIESMCIVIVGHGILS